MGKPKADPQDLTLHDEFEKNVETVIGILEDSISIIDQWIKDLPKSARTGGRFVPKRTINNVIAILENFYPFDLPEIQRFLITHVPEFESKVEKQYSAINKKIDEIVGKCGQHPFNPPLNPAIPFWEMSELRGYMKKLIEDLSFCVKTAREKEAAGIKPASGDKAGDAKETGFTEVSISKLIEQGESHTIEFKEIPECNTQQNRKNNDVLFPSLKTIAGFLNASGGTLLIGVDDSGKKKGIEPYLNTMKQGNNDKFEQKIRNYLMTRFKPQPIGKVKISFASFREGTICRVDVQTSDEIIHLDDKVYVREGNTTQELKGRDLTDWTQQRRLPTDLPSGK